MKRRTHTPEQIVRKLREADRLLAEVELDTAMLKEIAEGLGGAIATAGEPGQVSGSHGRARCLPQCVPTAGVPGVGKVAIRSAAATTWATSSR